MAKITALRYQNKSHRKLVRLPPRSVRFAEFIGIMMGDGGINNEWQANITLNSIADRAYADYVVTLCVELFGITPTVRKRKTRNALVLLS